MAYISMIFWSLRWLLYKIKIGLGMAWCAMLKIEGGSPIRQYMDFIFFAYVILNRGEVLSHVIMKFLMPRKLCIQSYHFFSKKGNLKFCKLHCGYCLHMLFSIRKHVLMILVYRCFNAKKIPYPTILFFPKKKKVMWLGSS